MPKYNDALREAVKDFIQGKPPETLLQLLLDFARLIPEDDTGAATRRMELISDQSQIKSPADILVSAEELRERAENGDFSFEYYDSYSDDYDIEDTDNFGPIIETLLCDSIKLVKQGSFSEALEIMDVLFDISVPFDYGDDITVHTCFREGFISVPEDDVINYWAAAALMSLSGDQRLEKIIHIFTESRSNLHVESVIKTCPTPVPGLNEFLSDWIEYLTQAYLNAPNWYTDRYDSGITEAVKLRDGIDGLYTFAQTGRPGYEAAYIKYIKDRIDIKNYHEAIKTALEGLSRIKGAGRGRRKIADMLLEAAQESSDRQSIEIGLLERFISSWDLDSFLDIYEYNEALKTRALDLFYKNAEDKDLNGWRICFLDGRYEYVWKKISEDKTALGWSNSLKGKLFALFPALITNNLSRCPCLNELLRKSLSDIKNEQTIDSFIAVIRTDLVPAPDSEREKYWNWCLKETEQRVEGIVRNQHRGAYARAALLITSMADVFRQREGAEKASEYINAFRQSYPRHSSFRGALAECARYK
jgi:hypothetical protein